MDTQTERRPYGRVRSLVESIGGTMTWQPGGGPGGVWELNLRGRTARIEARADRINALDRLYVARVDNPRTWDDYDPEAPLTEDAFWRLVRLFL